VYVVLCYHFILKINLFKTWNILIFNVLILHIFIIFLTSQRYIYIYIYDEIKSPLHKECQEELQSSHKGIRTAQTSKYSAKTLVNTKIKQWVRPQTMIIRSKSNSRGLQPPIREHLDFVQHETHGAFCVVEQWFRSFHMTQTQTSQISCKKDWRA
jgi:hypothetical protein